MTRKSRTTPDRGPAGREMPTKGRQPAVQRRAPATAIVATMCVALVLATVAVYAQTRGYDFVAYDDDSYVCENPVVREGLSADGVLWAFGTFHAANWHPLTWLSHMVDCELLGLDGGAHHVVNLALHAVNTLVLLALLAWMTGRMWESAIVAGVFALHPTHVESVAWVAERKDLLSTFFALVTLAAYVRYIRRRSVSTYLPVVLAFALALMAKPMPVTLPFLLLLLDAWPLGRFSLPPRWTAIRPLLVEKMPLFAMAAASCAVTVVAQRAGGAVQSLAKVPLYGRVETALVGYGTYVARTFWPAKLTVLYPIHAPSTTEIVVSAVGLAVVTAGAVGLAKVKPYFLTGWLWFLGMLVPVIGLVQVGSQSTADRYMYLPTVGLTLAVVWLIADLAAGHRALRYASLAAACAALAIFGAAAHRQTGYWSSSRALFERALALTSGNCIMHNNLGVVLAREGRFGEAIGHYREAIAIDPDYPDARANLGHELLRSVKLDEAHEHLAKAIALQPAQPVAQADIGMVLAATGRFDEAMRHLEESLRLDPGQASVRNNLGFVLQRLGRLDEAMACYAEALQLDPTSADAHYNLGTALAMRGKPLEAAEELKRALELNPSHEGARAGLQQLLRTQ